MSKPIETNANKLEFRRKLEILEPTILSTPDFEYTLSDVDFGSIIIVDTSGGLVKLTNFTPLNSGHIRIITARDTQPGDTLAISIEIAAFDMDNFAAFAVVSTIDITDYAVNGMDLYYDKPNTKWYCKRITSNRIYGLLPDVSGAANPTGVVGEYVTNQVVPAAFVASGSATVGELTLDPGRWLLFGFGSFLNTAASLTYRSASILKSSGLDFSTVASADNTLVADSGALSLNPAPRFLTLAAPAAYKAMISVVMTAGSVAGGGRLSALRVG